MATAPVSMPLVMPLLVEPALSLAGDTRRMSALRPLARSMPFGAARDALSRTPAPSPGSLGAVFGGTVFTVVTLLVLVAGGWSLLARDG